MDWIVLLDRMMADSGKSVTYWTVHINYKDGVQDEQVDEATRSRADSNFEANIHSYIHLLVLSVLKATQTSSRTEVNCARIRYSS